MLLEPNHRCLPSFPTRRSSDLCSFSSRIGLNMATTSILEARCVIIGAGPAGMTQRASRDRKSTRLNYSHTVISYAVFYLKKKIRGKTSHDAHHRPLLVMRSNLS